MTTTPSELTLSRAELTAVDESLVRAVCGERGFADAEAALARGIRSPQRRGLTIQGEVQNERRWASTACVTFDFSSFAVRCDCRSTERYCAHVGALLLMWARRPGEFAQDDSDSTAYTVKWSWPMREARETWSAGDPGVELRRFLGQLLVADLRGLGRRLDLRLRGSAKSDLIDQLVNALADPINVVRALRSVGPDLRMALAAVYAFGANGAADHRRLKAALGRLIASGVGVDSLLGELAARGLVFLGSEDDGPTGYQVPSTSWPHLPPVDALEVTPEPAQPSLARSTFADSLLEIWAAVRNGRLTLKLRPPVLPSALARAIPALGDPGYLPEEIDELARLGRLTAGSHELTVPPRRPMLDAASLAALGDRVGSPAAAELAWHVLVELGLAAIDGVATRAEAASRDLLWLDQSGRLRAIIEAWLRVDLWTELDLALLVTPALRVRRRFNLGSSRADDSLAGQSDLDRSLVEARRFVARVISLAPEGAWLTTESLLGLIWRMWPDFIYGEAGGRSRPSWWLEVDRRRVDLGRFSDWVRGPGTIVVATIAGPLHWLGIVDLAGPVESPTAFRLRPEARLIRGASVPGAESLAPIELGPGLEVRVEAGHPDSELRTLLETAARLLEVSPGGFRYALTPEGVKQLFDEGFGADDLLARLARRTASIPSETRDTLERWWRLHGQLRLYERLTLVELSDDGALDELMAATSLRRHLVHVFSPRLVAVDPAGAEEMFAELQSRGYMPLRESVSGMPSGVDPRAGAVER